MKNSYFFSAFIFFSINGTSQIINIPDANFKTKLLQANISNNVASSSYPINTPINIDTNGNGEIEVSEVIVIKALDVSNSNIASLNGIQSFTNLKKLICKNNLLTDLDVNNLTQLSFLDCSHNLLTNLSCQSSNNKIEDFNCSYNELSTLLLPNFYQFLDMGNQSIILNCSNNHLNNIVFNTLNGIEQFSSVILDNNSFSNITFPVLEILGSLSLSNNPLASVDFTNLSLHSQDPVYHYGFLNLNNTNLTTVVIPFDISFGSSISNNQYLTYINFKNNQSNIDCYYQDEDETIYICNGPLIENNPSLNTICCDVNEQNYFSVNYPTIQILTDCSLLINDIENKQFTLFPNPTSDVLNIKLNTDNVADEITIYNIIGQKVLSFKAQQTINVSILPPGTYCLKLESQNGIAIKNFIKN